MTKTQNEEKYHKKVDKWLAESFADVDHEPTLESGLHPDFIAYTPFDSYVLEVEDGDSLSELYNGLGQCLVYSSQTGHEPVLVLPSDIEYDGPMEYGPVKIVLV